MCRFFFADLAVQIRYVHYNICCFILLFYLRAYVNAEMAPCVVAMTTSSALFIGHSDDSISVDASRDRPKAITKLRGSGEGRVKCTEKSVT